METCKALEAWLRASLTEKQWRNGHLTILLLLLSLLLLLRLLRCHMAGQRLRGQACGGECPTSILQLCCLDVLQLEAMLSAVHADSSGA